METRKRSKGSRRSRKRGGNLTTLGQAAINFIVPAGLAWAAKRQQRGRSFRSVMRNRKY
jgi:hypothetical protein